MCSAVLKRKMLPAFAPAWELCHNAIPSPGRYPSPSHARSAGLRRRHGRLRYGEPICGLYSFLWASTSNGGRLGQRSYASRCAGAWGCCRVSALEGEAGPNNGHQLWLSARYSRSARPQRFGVFVCRQPRVRGCLHDSATPRTARPQAMREPASHGARERPRDERARPGCGVLGLSHFPTLVGCTGEGHCSAGCRAPSQLS